MTPLTSAQRRALRARAHALHPVVAIGHHGLTPAVLKEIDVALRAHELVKVRVFGDDRVAREALLDSICAALECAPVQHIGKLLVVWRPAPAEEAAAKAPKPAKRDRAPSSPRAAATSPAARKTPAARPPRGAAAAPADKRVPPRSGAERAPRAAPDRAPSAAAARRRGGKTAAATPPAPVEPRGDQSRRRRRSSAS